MAHVRVIIDFREVKEFGPQDVLDAMSHIDEAPVWDNIAFAFRYPPFHEGGLRLALEVAFLASENSNYKFSRVERVNRDNDGIILHYRRYHLKDI